MGEYLQLYKSGEYLHHCCQKNEHSNQDIGY